MYDFNRGTLDMELAGRTLYVAHDDANKPRSSSYKNNSEVKYFKYFTNAVATLDEIDKLADCSKDKCA